MGAEINVGEGDLLDIRTSSCRPIANLRSIEALARGLLACSNKWRLRSMMLLAGPVDVAVARYDIAEV